MTRLPPSLERDLIPRLCRAGPLTLDLFHRDAQIGGDWLRLHPREFGVLWRLAETPGAIVDKRTLLADVWRLDYEPETNSLEVHVARLRKKLARFDFAWLIETGVDGGYRLRVKDVPGVFSFSDDGGG